MLEHRIAPPIVSSPRPSGRSLFLMANAHFAANGLNGGTQRRENASTSSLPIPRRRAFGVCFNGGRRRSLLLKHSRPGVTDLDREHCQRQNREQEGESGQQ
jgi:hypothetical protein